MDIVLFWGLGEKERNYHRIRDFKQICFVKRR